MGSVQVFNYEVKVGSKSLLATFDGLLKFQGNQVFLNLTEVLRKNSITTDFRVQLQLLSKQIRATNFTACSRINKLRAAHTPLLLAS